MNGTFIVGLFLLLLTSSAIAETEEEATMTNVGQPAPTFALKTLNGDDFVLDSHKGKVVLVNFFTTTCGSCLTELPHIERIWNKRKDKGLIVIAIGCGASSTDLVSFSRKHKLTFPIAADPSGAIYHKYATQYVPRTYVISRGGTIVYQSSGFREFDIGNRPASLGEADLTRLEKAIRKELARK